MTKRALITGITGQDGSYLAELLLEKGYTVYGLARRTSNNPFARIEHIKDRLHTFCGNVTDLGAVRAAMQEAMPDELYSLAAQSHVGDSFQCEAETLETNYYGVLKVVDEALRVNPDVRIYQASTSEMFGNATPPQDEHTAFCPQSPYAKAKLQAHENIVVRYRKEREVFICSGFLFNHESPRRGEHFVTRKITRSLAKIALGLQNSFELGNLDARRDWGFAGDYVEAMWMMLQRDTPEDFVIATGQARMVREFVEAAAHVLDMRITWEGAGLDEVGRDQSGRAVVRVNPKFYRPAEVHYLQGDSTKALYMLGWQPKTLFASWVKMMVEHDYNDLTKTMRR